MKVIETVREMKQERQHINKTVGCVPTMGYLHEGHLTLARRARQENAYVVVTIFVNPTQFGPKEDFKSYPRDVERDLSMLKKENVDIVFIPSAEDMYPQGFNTWVEVKGITEKLEGAARPGHFIGVTTVVNKLFEIISPTRAYFGQKDAQQLLVIKKMVSDLNMNLEIIGVPTVREADGLAMSSRNVYLNPEQRKAASVLSRSLKLAEHMWSRKERNAELIKSKMIELIKTEPLADIDYISIADINTLEEIKDINKSVLISMAVRFGKTRLIDNVILS